MPPPLSPNTSDSRCSPSPSPSTLEILSTVSDTVDSDMTVALNNSGAISVEPPPWGSSSSSSATGTTIEVRPKTLHGNQSYLHLHEWHSQQGDIHIFLPHKHIKLPPLLRKILALGPSFKLEDPAKTIRRMNMSEEILETLDKSLSVQVDYTAQEIDWTLLHTPINKWSSQQPSPKLLRTMTPDQEQLSVLQLLGMSNKHYTRAVKKAELLLQQHQAMMCPTDKNLGMAIVPIKTYLEMALDFLVESESFTPTTKKDMLQRAYRVSQWTKLTITQRGARVLNNRQILPLPKNMPAELTEKLYKGLPHYYILLKIHKLPIKPRPIVCMLHTLWSDMDLWLTKRFRKLVEMTLDHDIMHGYVVTTIKHSEEALERITWMVERGCVTSLASGDVTQLYTILSHQIIMEAMRFWLQFFAHVSWIGQKNYEQQAIMDVTELFLNNLGFQFTEDSYWIQHKGIAMGSSCSPDVATLTLTYIEYQGWPSICQAIGLDATQTSPGIYIQRYLDDVLTSEQIIPHLRRVYEQYGLSLTVTSSTDTTGLSPSSSVTTTPTPVVFLDLSLTLDPYTRTIHSDLYVKPGKCNTYLHFNSSNPIQHYRSIVYGFMFRLLRLCNQPHLLNGHIQTFQQAMLDRGTPHNWLKQTMEIAYARVHTWVFNAKAKKARRCELTFKKLIKARVLPNTILPVINRQLPRPPLWISIEHHPRLLAPIIPLSGHTGWLTKHGYHIKVVDEASHSPPSTSITNTTTTTTTTTTTATTSFFSMEDSL